MIKPLAKAAIAACPRYVQDVFYYARYFGRLPSIRKPSTFNERVLHRKYFENRAIYTMLADKLLVRDFVADRIGEGYLVPLLFSSADPGDLLELETWAGTVVKPNHAAGMVRIIADGEPNASERLAIIDDCRKWLQVDFSRVAGERHYEGIEPRIMVERLLGDGVIPPNDYKFHWFNRESGPEFVLQVVHDRFSQQSFSSRGYYLNSLTNCVWSHGGGRHSIPEDHAPLLQEAIELNQRLASDFEYVRVDWYVSEGRLYFGELTFTPGAGRINEFGRRLDRLMGDMWPKHRPLID